MALNPKTSVASRNLALNAAFDVLNGGFLRLYDGVQPADADTALSGNTLLAELGLNATFAPAASSATKTANAITDDSSANATGTCTWASLVTSGGTRVHDMSAGTASANLILNTTSIVALARVSCSSLVITQAA